MKILVINAGSSSLKYQLFDMEDGTVIAKGLCEKIGIGGAVTHKRPGKENYSAEVELKTHDDAIALVLKLLTDKELGVIDSVDEIGAVGHRVAHGGEKLKKSALIGDAELYHRYVDMISDESINITDPESVRSAAAAAASDFVERIPNTRKKLERIFEVMLYAHAASKLRASAEQILSTLR